MIVSEIRHYVAGGVSRLDARVQWEDSALPPLDLFFETDEVHARSTSADPNVFFIACILPAWARGERRVHVAGALCPLLVERSRTALGMLSRWHPGEPGSMPVVEPAAGWDVREAVGRRSIAMLSCGIDSLATLRWNMLHVPRDHTDSIRAVVHFALDDDIRPSSDLLHASTAPRRPSIDAVSGDAGVEAIPLRTNVWWLMDDGYFYTEKWHGACLASMLAVFGAGFSKGCIASSHSPAVVEPYGSHPLLDPYFSSGHFRIEHDLFSMSRSEKIALVADWPVGMANVRVCQNDVSGKDNCGTCEKCIRTQVQFAALGKLDRARAAFPHSELTAELVATIEEYDMIRGHPYFISWYREAIPMLREQGFGEVAETLSRVVQSASAGPDEPH